MYKEILNYLGCPLSLPASITFTHSSRSGTKASLWTPFTDNATCAVLKLNLKSCTNMLPHCEPSNGTEGIKSYFYLDFRDEGNKHLNGF